MTIIDAVTGQLCLWTIYDNPLDEPGFFVARLFIADKPTLTAIKAPTYDELRALLLRLYPDLVCIPRDDRDEAQIVETWL